MAAPIIDRDAMPVDRRRRHSGAPVLGLLLIALGVIWFLEETGLLALSAETVLSVLLMVVGLSLILTARRGRMHWPIILGAVLTLVLIANSGAVSFNVGNMSDQLIQPASASELQNHYQTGFGRMTLDLSQLKIPDLERHTIKVNHGFGPLIIDVPQGQLVRVQANIGAGKMELCGKRVATGPGINGSYGQVDPSQLTLVIQQGFGSVTVRGCRTGDGAAPLAPTPPTAPTAPTPA